MWCAVITVITLLSAIPALAQQKTGPSIVGGDSLTRKSVTLYGGVLVRVRYDFVRVCR